VRRTAERTHQQEQDRREDQQRQTDRPRHEHHRVAVRHDQRAAHVLFHQRPKDDEAEHQRRRLAVDLVEQVTEQAEQRHDADFGGRAVEAVGADRALSGLADSARNG